MPRPRACGALIHNDTILLVRHVEPTRSYWTLPGGGLEAGETPAEAAVREVMEETGVAVEAVRLLWEGSYGHGHRTSPEYCFLVAPAEKDEERQSISLGHDPEEAHLPLHQRLLQGVAWVPLAELAGDAQVARVLMALAEKGNA
ncbi:MAG: NUDIX domain-containing protein [Janthinobacterium lividum]